MNDIKKQDAFFDKVVLGGYDTVQVDEFVTEAMSTLSQLKNDNQILTQKLRVLADKINKYQESEQNPLENDTPEEVTAEKTKEMESNEKSIDDIWAKLTDISYQSENANNVLKEIDSLKVIMQNTFDIVASIAQKSEVSQSSVTDKSPNGITYNEKAAELNEDKIENHIDDVKQDSAPQLKNTEEIIESNKTATSQDGNEETTASTVSTKEAVEAVLPEEFEQKPEEEIESSELETTNLTYDEALTLLLSKKGIEYKPPGTAPIRDNIESSNESDFEKTKVLPTIDKIKPQPVKQTVSKPDTRRIEDSKGARNKNLSKLENKKEKKPGFVSLIRKGINAILEDDDDFDDELTPAVFDSIKSNQKTLQFGKNYDIKKKN